MKLHRYKKWGIILFWGMGLALIVSACGTSSTPEATPTPTEMGGGVVPTQPSGSICDGLSGDLEMQVLVGPSDAVGLEPVAVGSIPFSVLSDEGVNIVQGSGSISYQDVLQEEWGTYTVIFDLEGVVSGECVEDEQNGVLDLIINTSGEQTVEVRAEGFQGDYPWAGSNEFELSMPVVEGATTEGEGWAFVLHLDG